MDPFRHVWLSNMDQHHDRAQQQAGGIGEILPCPAGGRAVDRLEHGHMLANIGRPRQPDRTSDLGCDVGENVAVEIRQHDHVERFRRVGQLGGADVDDPVLVLDVRVLGGNLFEDLMEEPIGHLHDVVFGEAGDLATIVLPGVVEGIADDLLRARAGNEAQALVDLIGLAMLDPAVDVLFVLAHDDHVHIGVLGRDEGVVRDAWTHIREETKRLAHGDIQALEPAALRRGDRRFEKDASAAQRLPCAGLDTRGGAAQIDRFADLDDLGRQPRARFLKDRQRRLHDLGTDAIAVGDGDRRGRQRARDRNIGTRGHEHAKSPQDHRWSATTVKAT